MIACEIASHLDDYLLLTSSYPTSQPPVKPLPPRLLVPSLMQAYIITCQILSIQIALRPFSLLYPSFLDSCISFYVDDMLEKRPNDKNRHLKRFFRRGILSLHLSISIFKRVS